MDTWTHGHMDTLVFERLEQAVPEPGKGVVVPERSDAGGVVVLVPTAPAIGALEGALQRAGVAPHEVGLFVVEEDGSRQTSHSHELQGVGVWYRRRRGS